MNVSQQALYQRLMEFQFDEPGTELTFASRLARESGWTRKQTERVIGEYKRFLLLTCEAGHVVSPSEQVDQVWHLHLIYTRSYWNELCEKVLCRPLHHLPTKGGTAEQARYVDLYNQTLASYTRIFGNCPPEDIWPSAEQRFGDDLKHVNVNTAGYWIIPKPRWPRTQLGLRSKTSLFAMGLLSLPLTAATSNPLDWRGPEFIAFYFLLVFVAAIFALIVRIMFAPKESFDDITETQPLDAYQAACLAGGPYRAVQAAFASMVHRGHLKIVDTVAKSRSIFVDVKSSVAQGVAPPPSAPEIEQSLYDAVTIPTDNIESLMKSALPFAEKIQDDLIQRGLLRSSLPGAHCVAASMIMASPLLVGIPKIVVGISRDRPVLFLMIACAATAIAALVVLLARARLTRRGSSMLESLKQLYAPQRLPNDSDMAAIPPHQLAMAVGIFGVGMLADGTLDNVHAMLPRVSSTGGCGGGGGCSGGGGGCGGGGGGGGGGCGGGGCGGCGG